MADADLARFIDRFTVEYVRTYPHPIERVWKAITDPAEFGRWLMPGKIDLRAGGAYEFGGPDWTGEVLAIEPPTLIRLGATTTVEGAPFWLQYELAASPEGTRMRFVVHNEPGYRYEPRDAERGGDLPAGEMTPWRPGSLGGWHVSFEMLGELLEGADVHEDGARWRELIVAYRTHIAAALPAAELSEPS